MSQLKPQWRNVASSGHILIKKSLYEKFIKFGVTGRYSSNDQVMEFLDLEDRRYTSVNLSLKRNISSPGFQGKKNKVR